MAEASERRSQAQNHHEALFRLRVNLALSVRTEWAPEDRPSLLWQSRCKGGKLFVSPKHDDFPALLAEALDALAGYDMDVRAAAADLGCTPSQLVKFLQEEPRAMKLVNDMRDTLGLRRLK